MLSIIVSLALTQASPRAVSINGAPLTSARLKVLEAIERGATRLPNGAWWYDRVTGAFGAWGGPTLLWLRPGLELGPACPANASGARTGVAINGRWLHPLDVQRLSGWLRTPLMPGRYLVDARGNASLENGVFLFNLFVLANANAARGRGGAGEGGADNVFRYQSRDFNAVGDGSFMGACTKDACAYTE